MHLNSSVLRSLVGWKRAILPADTNRCLRNGSKVAEQENAICIYKNTRQTNINTTMPRMSRRRMLATSAAALGGISILQNMNVATPSDDIGDKTHHLIFSLGGMPALARGPARGM